MNPAPTATMAPLITPAFRAPTNFVSYLGLEKKSYIGGRCKTHPRQLIMSFTISIRNIAISPFDLPLLSPKCNHRPNGTENLLGNCPGLPVDVQLLLGEGGGGSGADAIITIITIITITIIIITWRRC